MTSPGIRLWLIGSLILISGGVASPSAAYEQSRLFDSARSLGRGRTGVAAFDSDEATRMNPATLAETNIKYQLRILQLDAFVGDNTLSTIGELSSLATTSEGLGFLEKFDDKFGERQYLKAQLSPLAMRFGAFEFAPFLANTSWLELSQADEMVTMDWLSDSLSGMSFSYGFKLGNSLLLGLTLRPLYRWHLAGRIGFTDLMDFLPPAKTKFEDYTPLVSGFSLGADVGLLWKLTPDFRLGLVVRNAGDAATTNSFASKPPPLQQEVSAGLVSRSKWGSFDFDYYLDINGLDNRAGLPLLRLVNTGVELGRRVFTRDHDFGVVAGISEGYTSAGLFLDLFLLRLDLVSYGVEMGHAPGQQQDRRWGLTARSTMTF